MKDYIISTTILVGSLIIGFAIIKSGQNEKYQYIEKGVIFDKSSGKTYFTDQKQYLDRKGDRYQFD
tara:strand:+ start:281 stop:478 length:198 start_codon:yes stop_codon:yes gene_type:complete